MISTQYADLLVRDNFGDSGTIPSTGNPYESPDILPMQAGAFAFPLAAESYSSGSDLGKDILSPGVNNIYVRAKNLSANPSSGTVSLYYSSSNLLLIPQTWHPISLPDGSGVAQMLDASQSSTVGAQSICLSNPAFLLTNLAPPTNGAHYCLISILETPAHPVTIPTSFATNSALVSWVQNNPGVGWRNLNRVPSGQSQLIVTYGYHNLTAAYLIYRCVGNGLPTGSTLTLQSTDARCPFNFVGQLPAPDPFGNQVVIFEQWVPVMEIPGSSVVATVKPPQGVLPKGAKLKVASHQVPLDSIPLDMKVASSVALVRGHPRADANGQASLIKLGESTVLLEP